MNTISYRISVARRLCRFTMDDLVQRMGEHAVSKMAISKFERGLIQPSPATLKAIADACRLPLSFFNSPSLNLSKLDYRFSKSVGEEQRREITAMANRIIQEYFILMNFKWEAIPFVHPAPRTILRHYADAEEAALRLRQKWELGLQPIHSVYELLACYGIHVFELDFGCENVLGVSTMAHDNVPDHKAIPIIIINARACVTTERKRFTALHELCHLLFRLRPDDEARHSAYMASLPPLPFQVTIKQPNEERLCDLFASAMLMPAPCVLRRFGSERSHLSIEEFKSTRRLYGNSIASQIHRLHDLRIIDDTLYHQLYETIIDDDRKEEHLGEPYPIIEVADVMPLLEERVREEMKEVDAVIT